MVAEKVADVKNQATYCNPAVANFPVLCQLGVRNRPQRLSGTVHLIRYGLLPSPPSSSASREVPPAVLSAPRFC